MISTALVPATARTIAEAAVLIRAGDLVAFPTETVYGLGANALNETAVYRIFAAKGRPSTDPLIVHVADETDLARVAINVPDLANRLIQKFWPGPLTLILPRHPDIPANVSAGMPTVAVRAPSHPVAQALIREAGVPIAAPSANRFAHVSPTQARHVLADLSGHVPLILDGGATTIGLESTILDVTRVRPRLLRPGAISLAALSVIAPNVEVTSRYATSTSEIQIAPGQLQTHYAPTAQLFLFEGESERVRAAMRRTALEHLQHGNRIGLLIADEDQELLDGIDAPCAVLGSLTDLEQIARRLYTALRELDEQGVDVILARSYPSDGIGLAIRDRLIRAASGRLISC